MNQEHPHNCSETERKDTKNLDDPTLYFMEIGMSQGIETKSPSPLVDGSLSCTRQNSHLQSPVFTLSGDIQQDEKSVISVPNLQVADEAEDRYSSPLQEPETIITSSAQDRYSSLLQEAETIDISTNGVLSAPSFRFCETIDEIDEKYTSSFQESELDNNLSSAITIISTDPLQEPGTINIPSTGALPAPSFRFCETIDEIDEKYTSSFQESESIISRDDAETLPTSSLQVSELDNNLSSAITVRDDAETLPTSSLQGLNLDNNLSSAIIVRDDAKTIPPVSSVPFFETFDDQVLSSYQESKSKSSRKMKKGASTDAAALHAVSSVPFFETFDDQVLSSYQESKSKSSRKMKKGASTDAAALHAVSSVPFFETFDDQVLSSYQESNTESSSRIEQDALTDAATPQPVLGVPFFETLDDQVLSSFHESTSESSKRIKQGASSDAAAFVSGVPSSEKFDRQSLSSFQKSKLEGSNTMIPVENSALDKGESKVTPSEADSSSIRCDTKMPISRFQFFEKIDDQHLSSFQDLKCTDIRSFRCQSTKRSKSVHRREGKNTQFLKAITQVVDGENYSSCLPTKLENSESDCLKSEEHYDEDLARNIALRVLNILNSLSEEMKTETNQCNNENRCEVGDRLYSFSTTKQTEGKEYRRRIADNSARANPSPLPLPKKKILKANKNLHSELKITRRISDDSIEVILMAKDGTKNNTTIQAQDKNSCIEMDHHFRFERLHGLSEKKQQLGKERRKRIEIERRRLNPSKPPQKIVQIDSVDYGLHLDGTSETCGSSLDSS